MDVGCIYNIMLVWLLWKPNSHFPGLLRQGKETLQGELFDFSEDSLKVCKLDGVFVFFFPYWKAKKHDLSQ